MRSTPEIRAEKPALRATAMSPHQNARGRSCRNKMPSSLKEQPLRFGRARIRHVPRIEVRCSMDLKRRLHTLLGTQGEN